MMKIILQIIGVASLAFSIVGFIETAIAFYSTKGTYHLGKTIIYCLLLGIGLALR